MPLPLPAHLQQHDPGPDDSATYRDPYARQGQVVDVVYPEDRRSIGKKLVEYDVEVQYVGPAATAATTRYRATLADGFGSWPDRSRRKLRAAPLDKNGLGKGAKVLLVCLGGERSQAVIVAGLRDTSREDDVGWEDSDLHLEAEFNGVGVVVREDGTAQSYRVGPRDLDGKVSTKPSGVCTLDAGGDGSVQLAVRPELDEDPDHLFRLDRGEQRARVRAPNGLHVGEATDAFLLGTTYRDAERDADRDLATAWQQVAQVATALSVLAATIAAKIAVPVTGGPACAADFVVLGQQFGQLAGAANRAAQAVAQFEGKSGTFLSPKNKTD